VADPKKKALTEVQRAQAAFEKTASQHDEAGEARRKVFEKAQAAGLTLREIGEAADLHWTRIGKIIGKR
jgi:hypothetical protein